MMTKEKIYHQAMILLGMLMVEDVNPEILKRYKNLLDLLYPDYKL